LYKLAVNDASVVSQLLPRENKGTSGQSPLTLVQQPKADMQTVRKPLQQL